LKTNRQFDLLTASKPEVVRLDPELERFCQWISRLMDRKPSLVSDVRFYLAYQGDTDIVCGGVLVHGEAKDGLR